MKPAGGGCECLIGDVIHRVQSSEDGPIELVCRLLWDIARREYLQTLLLLFIDGALARFLETTVYGAIRLRCGVG